MADYQFVQGVRPVIAQALGLVLDRSLGLDGSCGGSSCVLSTEEGLAFLFHFEGNPCLKDPFIGGATRGAKFLIQHPLHLISGRWPEGDKFPPCGVVRGRRYIFSVAGASNLSCLWAALYIAASMNEVSAFQIRDLASAHFNPQTDSFHYFQFAAAAHEFEI